MGIFLNDSERGAIKASLKDKVFANVYWGLLNRARRRAEAPGQTQLGGDTEWWHNAAELLTDGALACALAPSPEQKAWLKGVTLDIARRPVSDWIGPFFRNHSSQPPQGHLETAHLSIAVSVVYDLHPDLFTPSEAAEIVAALKEKGIALCLNWLDASRHLMNWRCIMLSGVAVAAAVLDEKETLKRVRSEYELCLNVVQPDGSYAESLQYSNYCYYGLMMTYESLVRRQPELEAELSVAPYAKAVSWFASSLL